MAFAGAACPKCGSSNQFGSLYCSRCATPLEVDPEATIAIEAPAPTTGFAPTGWSRAAAGSSIIQVAPGAIPPGSTLGDRYEILSLLGEGGMGAVYKARDRELDRIVALKVIRPQLATNPEVLARFKQELILARQVTHKNVIRIFDLGMAEGTKFITMEYVEGQDLKALLRERTKYPAEEAADILLQVCAGLNAAHQENVIHRDLKPHNIMIDPQGRVLVMDFGLALSAEAAGGMTRTGALMGTPDYMSPEQATGDPVDARSDIFGLGIIFYEMLTGTVPFEAPSLLKTLLKRTKEKAQPPIELEPGIPQAVNDIIMKCLATDPAERYQSTAELLTDLEIFRGITPAGGVSAPNLALTAASTTWKWISVSLAVALALIAGVVVWQVKQRPPAKQKSLTLLVADFNNATGDPVFEGTLEPMFTIALEGASFVNAYNRFQARQLVGQVQAGATRLDENVARLVAVREAINVVVSGTIARQPDGYEVSVKAIDAVTGKVMASQSRKSTSKEAVLASVGKLAVPLRKALGDATPQSAQIEAAGAFTAASLEAAHVYAVAQDLRFAGNAEEAIKNYLRAAELDQRFGSAYAGLASAYANLGQRQQAEKYFQMALAATDRMTDREKYRVRGQYYLLVRNPQKALEEFTALVKLYPLDMSGRGNLALAYSQLHDMPRAVEEARRALDIYGKSLIQRNNFAQYALYAGDFETAIRESKAVIAQSPSYFKAYRGVALAQLAQGKTADATETYGRLQAVNAMGASFATLGLADLALYEGRVKDAAAILEKNIEASGTANNAAAARKFAMLAEARWMSGRKGPALEAAARALAGSRELSVAFLVARLYLEAGQYAKAQELAAELSKSFQPDPQAFAKLIEGEAELKRGKPRDAIRLFEEAQKLADTWVGRYDLGRGYLSAQEFTTADSQFERCLKRRGEATEVFVDGVPTYRFLPEAQYYLGRAQEAMKSPGAAESYKAFLAAKEKSDPDPMVADARKRLAAR